MNARKLVPALGAACMALVGLAAQAQNAEPAWGRVISATPVSESTGMQSFNVTYEYDGRQYTTRTESRPGAYIRLHVGDYGVATAAPARAVATPVRPPLEEPPRDWRQVSPEPGVVVSGGGAVAAPVVVPAPTYYAAPVSPVYVQPAWPYAYPYVYPPVGLSLNLGYSRGWGGGWHGHRHWR